MSQTVTLINPQLITAWQISTNTAGDVVEALNFAAQNGWQANVTCSVQANSNNPPTWTVSLRCNQTGQSIIAYNTDWLVSDGIHFDRLTDTEFTAMYQQVSAP